MLGFFLVVFAILSVLGGLYWFWRRNIDEEITEGAGIEWAHLQKHEAEFLEGLTETQFREIYRRVHEPRFPGYALATVATFFVTLPLTLGLLSFLLWGAAQTGVIPEPIEVAEQLNLEGDSIRLLGKDIDEATRYDMALYYIGDLAGFYYFFGVLIVWLAIVALFMRRFHARRPGYLRDEIIRSRE